MFNLKKVSEEIVTVDGKVKKVETFTRTTCLSSLKAKEEAKVAAIAEEIASASL